ncbi:hypothetical protein ACWCYZ_27270 [Streptomyces virginiae]
MQDTSLAGAAAFGPATAGLTSEIGTGFTSRRPVPPRPWLAAADTPITGRTAHPGAQDTDPGGAPHAVTFRAHPVTHQSRTTVGQGGAAKAA